MGLVDFFKKKPVPAAAPSPEPPAAPFSAKIATLQQTEAVGTVSLRNGATLRFGASACQGFLPASGTGDGGEALAWH